MASVSKKEDNSKISVIMGIYNCASTLPEAIESILNQTYVDWELILCDDASTDNTYDVAKIYQEKYPEKIVLIRNKVNSKLSFTLNHCLEYATGTYVARMDGDDISLPERFEKEIAYLRTHPEYDLVGCAMQRFNDKGKADVMLPVQNPDYYTLRRGNPFFHATILTYKRVYDALGGYTVSERTIRSQDFDLWFRFYHAGFNGNSINDALYLVREDEAAIRRRTAKVRWNAIKTTRYGFKLLGYPKWWIIKPVVVAAIKTIIPYRFIDLHRQWKNNNN